MDPAAAPKVEPSGVGTLVTWLEINRTRVLVIGLAVVLVTLAAVLYLRHESERETRASFALSEVRTPMNPANAPAPGTVDAYLKVAQEYPGSQAAPRAILMAAGTLFMEGKYAESQKLFERVSREYPGNPWAAQASLGVAKTVDAQKNIPEAITRYEDVRKRYANTSAADEATLGVARMYELQGKNEQAVRLYHDLSQSSSSSIGARAGFRKEALVEKYPELTNAIAPIMATPTMMPPPGMPATTNAALAAMQTNMLPNVRTNIVIPSRGTSPRPDGSIVPYRLPETETPPPGAPIIRNPTTPTPGAPNPAPGNPAPSVPPTAVKDASPSDAKPAPPKTETPETPPEGSPKP